MTGAPVYRRYAVTIPAHLVTITTGHIEWPYHVDAGEFTVRSASPDGAREDAARLAHRASAASIPPYRTLVAQTADNAAEPRLIADAAEDKRDAIRRAGRSG